MRRLAWILGFLCAWPVWAVDLPFVNWENHPIHALDRSPNGRLLAVAHTADQRVQLFDISSGAPVAVGSVVVGIVDSVDAVDGTGDGKKKRKR